MRSISIAAGAALAAALLALMVTYAAGKADPPGTAPAAAAPHGVVADAASVRATVLRLHNRQRSRAGAGRLYENARLDRAAQRHAEHMVASGFFDHTAPDGSGLVDRLRQSGYIRKDTAYVVGENLRWQTATTLRSVMRSLMRSPEHRVNVLDPRFRDIGIGAAAGVPSGPSGRTYVVVFGVRP